MTRRLVPPELNDPEVWRGHLGRRASVRARITDDPAHSHTEAIGALRSVQRDERGRPCIALINRRGNEVTIVVADILAAKIL